MYVRISADPCRQQGERVRGGLTSNKGRREKIGQARPPAGPSLSWCLGRPSLPLGPARGSLDRSRAARKPAARGCRQVGSWQCRSDPHFTAMVFWLETGPIRASLPWCFGSARPSFDWSFAGSAGRRACDKVLGPELCRACFFLACSHSPL